MNLATTLWAYGTSEGVEKAWDTRGRGRTPEQNANEAWRQAYEGRKTQPDVIKIYHGTVLPNAKKIVHEGLYANPKERFGSKFLDYLGRPLDSPGYIYTSTNAHDAKNYAAFRSKATLAKPGDKVKFGRWSMTRNDDNNSLTKGSPAVVEFSFTKQDFGKLGLESDPGDIGYSWRGKGIPAQYISGVHLLQNNKWTRVGPNEL